MSTEIIPDQRDFKAIEQEHGRLPPDASDEQRRHRYSLALMLKMIRLHENGKLPLHLMREMDRIREGNTTDRKTSPARRDLKR
jgi:hypothetical protein